MEALKLFLSERGMSQTEFASLIGVTPGRVWQFLNDPEASPRAITIAKIEEVTGGRITFSDWVKAAKRREVKATS